MYEIEYERKARIELKAIKPYHRRMITKHIELLTRDPYPPKSIELEREYSGMGIRRLSVRKWRIIYRVDELDKVIYIKRVKLKIGPETYHDLI